jgi:hypothetical protein
MKTKRNFLLPVFLVIITLTIVQNFTFAYIFGNGSGGGYEGGSGDNYAVTGSINIEMLVVEGAGYFLNAQQEVMVFLQRVEMTGNNDVNKLELNTILQGALNNMYLASAAYDLLIRTAEVTPYNETVIKKLKSFDYEGYMTEKGMIPFIFNEVESYLGQGDITGMYKHIRTKMKDITGVLNLLKEDLTLFKMPPMSRVWQLNEMCCHTLIFGQYAARVFAAL